ncbi:MAG: thioredoxin family protein [Polyangia bacterium]
MVETPSKMVELGSPALSFSLPDTVSGRELSLDDVRGPRGALLMFICNHCPFVKHVRDELARLGRDYADSGIGIAAISANDAAGYPQDGPEMMKREAAEAGYPFPYLYDESQQTARAYGAACTPDFFLFDSEMKLVYRGQLDDSRPGNDAPVDGSDLRAALDALLAGEPIPPEQKPSIGCNIKWH